MSTTVNGTDYVPALNGTLINKDDCTADICSLEYAQLLYIPSFAGNLAYLAIFALVLVAQIFLGSYYRTWSFLTGAVCGLLLEIAGYVGRVLMHDDVFQFNYFVIYLVCLTIAPAFISASIYLCLSRLIVFYGEETARFSPKFYTYVFIACDLVSLVLQAAGGAMAAIADPGDSMGDTGVNIMIAGLVWQVVSLVIFIILSLDVAWRICSVQHSRIEDRLSNKRDWRLFHIFPWGLGFAAIAILIRCCFRVAELKDGFDGSLANNQTMFMVFEGPMIIAAVAALTVCHPGLCLGGRSGWKIVPQPEDAKWDTSELPNLTYSGAMP